MDFITIFTAFIAPLLTVEAIKKILTFVLSKIKGQVLGIPYGVKLVIGIVSGLTFAIIAQTGFEPSLLPYVNPILTVTIALASSKLYDLIHDRKK